MSRALDSQWFTHLRVETCGTWCTGSQSHFECSHRLLISTGSSSKVDGTFSSGRLTSLLSCCSCSSSSLFSKTSAMCFLPISSGDVEICLASGMEGIPASCKVLARFGRGEGMGEDDGELSILVKDREICSVCGLASRCATASDMLVRTLERDYGESD